MSFPFHVSVEHSNICPMHRHPEFSEPRPITPHPALEAGAALISILKMVKVKPRNGKRSAALGFSLLCKLPGFCIQSLLLDDSPQAPQVEKGTTSTWSLLCAMHWQPRDSSHCYWKALSPAVRVRWSLCDFCSLILLPH